MKLVERAKPLSGKTSFIWRIHNNSSSINLKRNGNILKLSGVGNSSGTTGTYALSVYGTTADNLVPYHAGGLPLTIITSITVSGNMETIEVNVSDYDRFVLYVVYGTGTHSNENVYLAIEN